MIQSRGQKVEGFSHRRSSSRTRNSWKKKSDNIKEKEKATAANCQSSKKKSSLNSIEIRINKTDDKSSKGQKSVRIIEPKSKEMFDDEARHHHEENDNTEDNEDVRIQAGIMINAQGGRSKDKGPYQYSRKVKMMLESVFTKKTF